MPIIAPIPRDERRLMQKAIHKTHDKNYARRLTATEHKLFGLIYPAYVLRAKGNYKTKTHGTPGALPWDSLEQKIQDILVDFIYQGFSGEIPMRAGMSNSRQELISYIENNTTISSYENGRHRANYLRGQ